jgi:hypothetical protein
MATLAEIEEAFRQGQRDGRIEGEDSLEVYCRFGPDDEPELYEAWERGFDNPYPAQLGIGIWGQVRVTSAVRW